ncbi:hypothetical protein M885DRAFT_570789 [Pelagophyceae sp. CCMP2097]|nr:hypothetical protein M885DRAFT_570789 [Pelagophyceae sp. CCMP2097]
MVSSALLGAVLVGLLAEPRSAASTGGGAADGAFQRRQSRSLAKYEHEPFPDLEAPCAEARSWAHLDTAAAFPKAKLRVLVHYHYYEDAETNAWKVINKRTNLLFFLRFAAINAPTRVQIVLTAFGLPPADEFFTSVGYPADLRLKWGRELLPSNVVYRNVAATTSDLCPRAAVLRDFLLEAGRKADYVLFLNDGVRGPFSFPQNSPQRSQRDAAAHKLGLPYWAARFVGALRALPRAKVIGVVGSCEVDLHVQSWAVMIDAELASTFEKRYNATCALRKGRAAQFGEVGACVEALRANHTMLSIWPKIEIEDATRACLLNAKKAVPKTRKALSGCVNPWTRTCAPTPREGEGCALVDLGDVVFTKFGGTVWDALPQAFKDAVVEATENELLGDSNEWVWKRPRLAEYELTRPQQATGNPAGGPGNELVPRRAPG